jgi:hypothetical protein
MLTSDRIAERSVEAARVARAVRLARKLYGRELERLPAEQWREVWTQVNAAFEFEENGGGGE